MPIQSGDGIDAMYRYGIGEARNSIKIVTGRNTINSKTVASSSKTMWGIFDTVEYGDTIIHAGYQKRNTSNQYMQTMTADEETEFSDLSLGVSYDTGDWFLMSEWIQSRSSYKANAMYIAAGYRIGKYTPYLIHSQITSGSFTPESMPSSLQLALAKRSQSTDSIGLRWDFKNNIDLKLQYDSVKLSENSNGFLVNVPSNQSLYGSTFNLFSAVVDFLF
jgi:predicted porin